MPFNANYVIRRSSREGQAEQPAGDAILPRRVGMAACNYRQHGRDMCTAVQQMVDQATGDVRAAIPRSQFDNTLIVFTSEHRE
jgi:hypothetical protein